MQLLPIAPSGAVVCDLAWLQVLLIQLVFGSELVHSPLLE
jgi:hypothetical protein